MKIILFRLWNETCIRIGHWVYLFIHEDFVIVDIFYLKGISDQGHGENAF